jgi:hypothetical protein
MVFRGVGKLEVVGQSKVVASLAKQTPQDGTINGHPDRPLCNQQLLRRNVASVRGSQERREEKRTHLQPA